MAWVLGRMAGVHVVSYGGDWGEVELVFGGGFALLHGHDELNCGGEGGDFYGDVCGGLG